MSEYKDFLSSHRVVICIEGERRLEHLIGDMEKIQSMLAVLPATLIMGKSNINGDMQDVTSQFLTITYFRGGFPLRISPHPHQPYSRVNLPSETINSKIEVEGDKIFAQFTYRDHDYQIELPSPVALQKP